MTLEKIYIERLDKLFDELKSRNETVDDEMFKSYVSFNEKHLTDVEDIIKSINEHKYFMIYIDDFITKVDIKEILYDSTYKYLDTDDYIDVYTIEYENGIIETICSYELLLMITEGGVKRKNGSILGINKTEIIKYMNTNKL